MADKPIVIIGSGIGGLSAAIRLASAGKRVVMLEKNPYPGGKMSIYEQDSFRWDTGPSVITMRHVFEDLFCAAGKQLKDYLELLPVEPLTRYFFTDGTVIDTTGERVQMVERIRELNPADAEGYAAFLEYAETIHRITGPVFIYDKPPTLKSFARIPVRDWLKADPFRTMQQAITHFVKDAHLRQILGRFATYVGGSPYQAPATLNVIADVELSGGVWYPKGGIYQIAEAMTRLAQELGVEIRCGCGVRRIVVRGETACAVVLEDGQLLEAQSIIANVDVTTVYKYLLPPMPSVEYRLKRLEGYKPSCSGFIMLLGVEGINEHLAHHNIFFSYDYKKEFEAIFKKQIPGPDPTVYVAITSKTDPHHAPEGCENWFVLVNAPALSSKVDWESEKQTYREVVLAKLASMGLDIRDKIRSEIIFTPVDLEKHTGAWRGALYGPSPNNKWTAFRRPHNRAPIKGLYFAGGTTHPGGGVPMVTLSGKVAAEMILEDIS